MKNPFDNLPGSDDEDNTKFTTVSAQNKNNTQKKTTVQPKTQTEKRDTRPNVNDNIVINQRENTKNHKSDREQKPVKEITDHRAHDRKSGTGRVSEPRKGGGGRGGIGNMKDELNQDKILAKVNEEGETVEETKEPQPEALTLEEYYAREGVDINNLDRKRERVVAKDAPKADWIAKEKLELVKTKQDNVLDGETKRVAVLKNQSHKIETSEGSDLLGFTSVAPKKQQPAEEREHREPREPRENRDNKDNNRENRRGNEKGGNKKYEEKKQSAHPKLVINEEDFPSL